jgi:methylated-DNA-protein-cysteine methyltransferase-like protein
VGYALHALPEHTSVPWHRVINAQGRISLRRPGGDLEQRYRLEAEGVRFDQGGRASLERFGWKGGRRRG